jgi:hypothetical protein
MAKLNELKALAADLRKRLKQIDQLTEQQPQSPPLAVDKGIHRTENDPRASKVPSEVANACLKSISIAIE